MPKDINQNPPHYKSKKKAILALCLGVGSIIFAFLIGIIAFRFSVKNIENRYLEFYQNKALTLSGFVSAMGNLSDPKMLEEINKIWEIEKKRPLDEFFCILDQKSNLVFHSSSPQSVGNFIGDNLLISKETSGPQCLMDLVEHPGNYLGGFVSSKGESQLVVFVPIPERKWIIGVHRSKKALLSEVKSGVTFFAAGFSVVSIFLFPLSLILLYRLFSTALGNYKDSEKRFRNIFENTLEGILIIDKRNMIPLVANQAFFDMLGIPENLPSKIPNLEFDIKKELPEVLELFEKITENNTMEVQNLPFTKPDGTEIFIDLLGATLTLDENSCLIGYFKDSTERKKAEEEKIKIEEQFQQTQKMESLGILAGGIAHDFNNILMTIMGNTNFAIENLSSDSPAKSFLDDVQKATKQAAELSHQMLAYSGKGRFLIQPVNLCHVVQEMKSLLESSINVKATIEFNLPKNLPAVKVDLTQIRQMILNLIINASEALEEESGTINLSISELDCDEAFLSQSHLYENQQVGTYICLAVSDTGKGMSEDILQKMFDPFFTTKFTGRGLGLAATLGIIRGHQGVIFVTSEVDKGTRVKVLFPTTQEQAKPITSEKKELSCSQSNETILVVEDEEPILKICEKVLTRSGFKVLKARNGKEALEIFDTYMEEIHCVIMDLSMPVMGGEETLKKIRESKIDVPIILSSGFSEDEMLDKFQNLGIAGILQKPYSTTVLIPKIEKALGK